MTPETATVVGLPGGFEIAGVSRRTGGALRHVKARLRSRLQDPAILERAVGLERGRQTDAPLLGDLPKRGRARPRDQRAVVDEIGDEPRGRLVPICRRYASRSSPADRF